MISEDTKFGDVRVGDVVPYGTYGEYVVKVERGNAIPWGSPPTITLTTVYFVKPVEGRYVSVAKDDPDSVPRLYEYPAEWAHETFRQSRARAEYMASVPD